MVKRFHVDAVPRIAASAEAPPWSAVTYWLVLTSWSVPAFGMAALLKTAAAPVDVAEATRLVLALEAATYLPDEATWRVNFPCTGSGAWSRKSDFHLGLAEFR